MLSLNVIMFTGVHYLVSGRGIYRLERQMNWLSAQYICATGAVYTYFPSTQQDSYFKHTKSWFSQNIRKNIRTNSALFPVKSQTASQTTLFWSRFGDTASLCTGRVVATQLGTGLYGLDKDMV